MVSDNNISCATQAIPVIRTQSTKVESLPIRAELNPTAKTSKGKCIIIQECISTTVDEEKLSPFFDLQCHQVQSLKDAVTKKNLKQLCNIMMQAKPEVIFVHLGNNDLRKEYVDIASLTKSYEKLLINLARVLILYFSLATFSSCSLISNRCFWVPI